MRQIFSGIAGVFILLALWGGAAVAADVAKIGVVDMQRFLTESNVGQSAQAQIESEGARMEKDLKEQGAAIDALKQKMEADAMVVSEDKREAQLREYRIKIGDLKALQQKYTTTLKKMEQELIAKVQKEATTFAEELGKKEGYLMLIEKTAIIYYPAAIDVTDHLIQYANEKKSDQENKQ